MKSFIPEKIIRLIGIERINVCQDLPSQYPPKPSAHMDLKNFKSLILQLFSVIDVPPKSVKWPTVCLVAAESKSPKPVNHIKGINHIAEPKINEKSNEDLFSFLV